MAPTLPRRHHRRARGSIHVQTHFLLHRRPHLRQPRAGGGRRRAAAAARADGRAPPNLLARARLDTPRADVRAARPRGDVRLDPVSADAPGLRPRRAVHRGQRLPADVRPRQHRHRHGRARRRSGNPQGTGAARAGNPGRPDRRGIRAGRKLRRTGAAVQRPRLPARGGRRDRGADARDNRLRSRLWRQLLCDRRAAGQLVRPRRHERGRNPAPVAAGAEGRPGGDLARASRGPAHRRRSAT